jgi:sec-independent protein translocase protein TatA
MGSFSIWHWLIVLVIIVLLFGRNRIPAVMGDLAKGIKAFKSGMKEEKDEASAGAPKAVTGEPMAKDEAKG